MSDLRTYPPSLFDPALFPGDIGGRCRASRRFCGRGDRQSRISSGPLRLSYSLAGSLLESRGGSLFPSAEVLSMPAADTALAKARQIFSQHGGMLRTSKAMRLGFTRVPVCPPRRWRNGTGRPRTLQALHGTTALESGPGANCDPDSTGCRLPCLGPGTSRANHPGSARCRHRATQSRAGSEGR